MRLMKEIRMTTFQSSTKTILATVTVVLLTAHPLMGESCGGSCCGSRPASPSGESGVHLGHSVTPSLAVASVPANLEGAAKAVFSNYLTIQAALANDSLDKVGTSAESLAKAIGSEGGRAFPKEIAEQAERLARARDLGAARKAFQILSESLVREVKAGKVPAGTFVEVYCPMAKSSWLQMDTVVRNPYFGRAMLDCGRVKT
jgi:hypothetical protein